MTPEEFWDTLHSMPEPQPVFYRLYYDKNGWPIQYSHEDLPGTYIDIDPKLFGSMNMRVKNGKLIQVVNKTTIKKLIRSNTGTTCHSDNVAIIVTESTPHQRWKLKTYETD